MKDFIRYVIREETSDDVEVQVMGYSGNNPKIQSYKEKIYLGKYLTDKEKDIAKHFFMGNEKMNEGDFLESLASHKKEIISLGDKTYIQFVRGTKKLLIKNSSIKVSKPDETWIKTNIDDLQFFRDNLVFSEKRFRFANGTMSIGDEIEVLLDRLSRRDFVGFIEEDGEKKEWSILNKINSNYTNWYELILDREKQGDLGPNTVPVKDKIRDYFEQQDYSREDAGMTEEEYSSYKRLFPTLSLADLDIVLSINSSRGLENKSEKLSKIIQNLKNSTEAGDNTEKNFIDYLIQKGYGDDRIKSFSSPGNLVDITFQTDLMILGKNGWIPIQVKSREQYTKLLTYGIKGAGLIYPKGKKWVLKYKDSEGLEQKKYI